MNGASFAISSLTQTLLATQILRERPISLLCGHYYEESSEFERYQSNQTHVVPHQTSYDFDLEKNVPNYMSTNPESARSSTKLHKIYQSIPPEKTVHFIVQLPPDKDMSFYGIVTSFSSNSNSITYLSLGHGILHLQRMKPENGNIKNRNSPTLLLSDYMQ
ncbi:11573_t:CDS:2, partial [Acaulospora colombiana]